MFKITITTEAGTKVKEYTRLHDAKAYADKQAKDRSLEVEVLNTETSTVAYLTSPRAIAKRDEGTHFVPFTRLETPSFAAPEIEGFYPAYTRKRIQATVYRAHDAEAEAKWLVHDGRNGGRRLCANTTESRKLMTAMRQGLLLEVEEAAEQLELTA